jgi:hypothetical protein
MRKPPSTTKYKRALEKIWPKLSDGQRTMLLAHYRAPGRTLTTYDLQAAAKYRRSSGVNLQYGKLGDALCREMAWSPPPNGQRSSSIASFTDVRTKGKHAKWHMHPELAQAIGQLRLIMRS